MIAFSRILDDKEIIVVANTNTRAPDITVHVQVDPDLSGAGTPVRLVYANPIAAAVPSSVVKVGDRVGVKLVLKPMQVQVLTPI